MHWILSRDELTTAGANEQLHSAALLNFDLHPYQLNARHGLANHKPGETPNICRTNDTDYPITPEREPAQLPGGWGTHNDQFRYWIIETASCSSACSCSKTSGRVCTATCQKNSSDASSDFGSGPLCTGGANRFRCSSHSNLSAALILRGRLQF